MGLGFQPKQADCSHGATELLEQLVFRPIGEREAHSHFPSAQESSVGNRQDWPSYTDSPHLLLQL